MRNTARPITLPVVSRPPLMYRSAETDTNASHYSTRHATHGTHTHSWQLGRLLLRLLQGCTSKQSSRHNHNSATHWLEMAATHQWRNYWGGGGEGGGVLPWFPIQTMLPHLTYDCAQKSLRCRPLAPPPDDGLASPLVPPPNKDSVTPLATPQRKSC